jgi:hypothetical protein
VTKNYLPSSKQEDYRRQHRFLEVVKGEGCPLQAWCGSWGSRRLRLLDLLDFRHYEGGKVVTLTHRPSSTPGVFLVLIFRGWVDSRTRGSVGSSGRGSPLKSRLCSLFRPLFDSSWTEGRHSHSYAVRWNGDTGYRPLIFPSKCVFRTPAFRLPWGSDLEEIVSLNSWTFIPQPWVWKCFFFSYEELQLQYYGLYFGIY